MATLPKFTESTLGRASKFNEMVEAVETSLDSVTDALNFPKNAEAIKTLYESNGNTNAYTDSEVIDVATIPVLAADVGTLQTDVGLVEADVAQLEIDVPAIGNRVTTIESENLPTRVTALEGTTGIRATNPGELTDYMGRSSSIPIRGTTFNAGDANQWVTLLESGSFPASPKLTATVDVGNNKVVRLNMNFFVVINLGGVGPFPTGWVRMRFKRTLVNNPFIISYLPDFEGYQENFQNWVPGNVERMYSFNHMDVGASGSEWVYTAEVAIGHDSGGVNPSGSWKNGNGGSAPYNKNSSIEAWVLQVADQEP